MIAYLQINTRLSFDDYKKGIVGKYVEVLIHSVSLGTKKKVCLQASFYSPAYTDIGKHSGCLLWLILSG